MEVELKMWSLEEGTRTVEHYSLPPHQKVLCGRDVAGGKPLTIRDEPPMYGCADCAHKRGVLG